MRLQGSVAGKYVADNYRDTSGVYSLRAQSLRKNGDLWPVTDTALPYTTNLFAHFDAADLSTIYDSNSGGSNTADAGAVGRWEDKSGNGRHFVQATANNRPVLRSPKFNGRPAIDFDGTNDNLSFVAAMPAAASVFIVMDSTKSNQVLFKEDDANNYWCYSVLDGTQQNANIAAHRYIVNAIDFKSVSATYLTGEAHHLLYKNGIVCACFTHLALSTWSGLMIAGYSGLLWQGFVCEVIVYNENISAANRVSVERYLRSKWRTP